MRELTIAQKLEEKYPDFFKGIHPCNVEERVTTLPSFYAHLGNIIGMVKQYAEPDYTFRFVQIKTKFDWICLYYDYDCSHGNGKVPPQPIYDAVKNAEAELGAEFKEMLKAQKETP